MPSSPPGDTATISEPSRDPTVSTQSTSMAATARKPSGRDDATTQRADMDISAHTAPASSHRIRRRSSDGDRRYLRYSMITPTAAHAANAETSPAATGSSERAAGRKSGLATAGSPGSEKEPWGAVRLTTIRSTGISTPVVAAAQSTHRSAARSGTPVGN